MHQGHRNRLKERFIKEGLTSFAPHEVLETLLFYTIPQRDVNPLAHELLNRFGSLEGVFSASKNALMGVKGIGEQSATFISLWLPLFEYYQLSKLGKRPSFSNRKVLQSFCLALLNEKKEETFYAIALDGQMNLIQAVPLAKGSSAQVSLSVRNVVQIALSTGAHSLALCHNHPGGTLAPSQADIKSTHALHTLLEALDIHLIDHIIVAGGQALSINTYEQEALHR